MIKYLRFVLPFIPTKVIAIYLLKEVKKLVNKTDNLIDDSIFEVLLNILIRIQFITEQDAINQKF